MRHLDRVVDAVAGDQCGLTTAAQFHRYLPRCVAGGGQQTDARRDVRALARDIDEVEQTCFPDGMDRVPEHLPTRLLHVDTRPVVPLGA